VKLILLVLLYVLKDKPDAGGGVFSRSAALLASAANAALKPGSQAPDFTEATEWKTLPPPSRSGDEINKRVLERAGASVARRGRKL
jgi:hypothetical protein